MRPNRDCEYLAKLRDYYVEHHILPPFSTIARLTGLRSTSTTWLMVNRLKKAGYLKTAPGRRIQPGPRFFETALLEGGQEWIDNQPTGYEILRHVLNRPSTTMLLPVKDKSMLNAGLLPGDHVVVNCGAKVAVGDIVVALVNNEYTVRYLAQDKNGCYLKPGNKKYRCIRQTDLADIAGTVLWSFRRYDSLHV